MKTTVQKDFFQLNYYIENAFYMNQKKCLYDVTSEYLNTPKFGDNYIINKRDIHKNESFNGTQSVRR